jgi:NAD(P)-dependent dehydrogenase (short-subunit alcohol dehydrogenase family)
MNGRTLDKLQVLVTGIDAAASRDVVRLLVAEGASVIAADRDAGKLARLERDAGLYRTHIETTEIDLADAGDVRLWEDALRAFRRLPHMIICCCGAPTAHTDHAQLPAGDVALSDRTTENCPARLAARILKPSLFLHAEPVRRSAFNRALAALKHPTLHGVLERSPGRSVFDPEAVTPYVRIASRLYSLRRHPDGDPAPLRFASVHDTGAERADAA